MASGRSHEDTRFWNQFLLVTMLLHVIIIGFFVLARTVGAAQSRDQAADPSVLQAVDARIRPLARVAVAGESAPEEPMAAEATPTAAPAKVASAELGGEEVFKTVCSACHTAGIAGAPRFGDAAAWRPRIAKGTAVLYRHSVEGFHGEAGFMPPKGGRPDLSDKSVHNGVDYMVAKARK
jgi:cytochrome c5